MENKERENNHESYIERTSNLNYESLREKEIFWKIRIEFQPYDITQEK